MKQHDMKQRAMRRLASIRAALGAAFRHTRIPLLTLGLVLTGVVGVAGPASAAQSPLCTGYAACIQAGYTDHGYGEQSNWSTAQYWHEFAGDNCTNYAAYLMVQNGFSTQNQYSPGYAYNWGSYFSSYKNTTPAVGSIAWWDASYNGASSSGHVAYVESITYNSDGSVKSFTASEDNWGGSFDWRVYMAGSTSWPSGFLHFKDLTGTASYLTAFQANDGNLYLYNPYGATNTALGMRTGTSPATAGLTNGTHESAFQDNQGNLWVYGNAGNVDTALGMMSTSSPSISGLSGVGYEVAFQSNQGQLWVYGNAGSYNTALGMMPTTNPAIAGLGNGSFAVAFSAWQSGSLYTYTPAGGATNTGLGIMHDTSPSITSYTTGGYEVAFQASGSGNLYLYNPAYGATNTGLGMMPGTSPRITHLSDGGLEVAFQANDGNLYLYNPATGLTNLQLGMKAGTSPDIVAFSSGGFEVSFQDNQGNLWVYGSAGNRDTALGMASGTSPSIG